MPYAPDRKAGEGGTTCRQYRVQDLRTCQGLVGQKLTNCIRQSQGNYQSCLGTAVGDPIELPKVPQQAPIPRTADLWQAQAQPQKKNNCRAAGAVVENIRRNCQNISRLCVVAPYAMSASCRSGRSENACQAKLALATANAAKCAG